MAIVKKAVEFQEGRVIEFTCTSDVVVGDIIPVGVSMVGIAVKSGLIGEVITLELEKVWTIKAKDSEAIAIGYVVYWDDTAKELTKTATDNIYAGRALSSKSTSAGTINVKINV
jgi:predicted RecA/RadA family phage recombinase